MTQNIAKVTECENFIMLPLKSYLRWRTTEPTEKTNKSHTACLIEDVLHRDETEDRELRKGTGHRPIRGSPEKILTVVGRGELSGPHTPETAEMEGVGEGEGYGGVTEGEGYRGRREIVRDEGGRVVCFRANDWGKGAVREIDLTLSDGKNPSLLRSLKATLQEIKRQNTTPGR
ncbi:hypothetical protein RJT34_09304 [Clitoria ternatea]|uniref:Uncharacterized protein n=1 Tax=Clitoria ternatea TaxID=43366 RepID=A0AAN9K5M6_CLITE